jgi:hypothetical protein
MTSIAEIVDGLEILAKTARVPAGLAEQGVTDKRTATVSGAGYDILIGPIAEPSSKDQNMLSALGWHYDSEFDCWCIFV